MSSDTNSGSGSSSKSGPIISTLKKAFVLAVVFYLVQVYIQRPGDRPIAACWPPYLLSYTVMVQIPKIVAPKEHYFIIENISRTSQFNNSCIATLSGFDWLTKKQRPTSETTEEELALEGMSDQDTDFNLKSKIKEKTDELSSGIDPFKHFEKSN